MRALARLALLVALLLLGVEPVAADAEPTFTIRGVVADHDGQPMPNVSVSACTTGGSGECHSIQTGPDGAFAIDGVPPGAYQVRVQVAGGQGYFGPGGFTSEPGRAIIVTVTDTDVSGIGVFLPAQRTISGTITGANGESVHAYVCANSRSNSCVGFAETTADGTYHFSVLAGQYTIEAHADDHLMTYFSVDGPGGIPATVDVTSDVVVDIQFQRAHFISGRVSYPGGIVLIGESLHPIPADTEFGFSIGVEACPLSGAGNCYDGQASEDGRFRFPARPGRYVLSFFDPNHFLLEGYWSSRGMVANLRDATPVDITAGDRGGIRVEIGPIQVTAGPGRSHSMLFTSHIVTVRAGQDVTVRFRLGKGFAGQRVAIWKISGTSSFDLNGYQAKRAGTRTVGADGSAYFTLPVTGWMGIRATYVPAGGDPGWDWVDSITAIAHGA